MNFRSTQFHITHFFNGLAFFNWPSLDLKHLSGLLTVIIQSAVTNINQHPNPHEKIKIKVSYPTLRVYCNIFKLDLI